ncbi:MAG TPA: hypothetical protein VFO91_01420 [Anaerolineales bacterium]|nr:hypothetical protein [Anaerolineales bacterium]
MNREFSSFSKIAATKRVYLVLVLSILIGYAGMRVFNLAQAAQRVKTTADTTAYMRISREAILDSRFLAAARPFIFPLVLKVFGQDGQRVAWAQGLFSIVSWSVLAFSVALSLHSLFLRLAAFGFVLLFSLHRYIIAWDSVLLTESLSLSLMALFLAGWLWLLRGWHWRKALFLFAVAFLWAFCRDTNAWVVLMVALFLLLLVALRAADRRFLPLSLAFLLMFFLSNLTADLGGRWIFPFQNVLGRRILPDERAVEFFAACGMPVSPALMQLSGGYANSLERAFYEDPALEGYRVWLHRAGKACYVEWLLSDPIESVRVPLAEFNALIGMEDIQPSLFSRSFSPLLPARLEAVLFPRRLLLLLFPALLGITLLAVLTRAWKHNQAWWAVIGLAALVFPHYFIVWHGDAMGIYRHVVSVGVQFYLGAWLVVLFVADRVLSFRAIQEMPVRQLWMRSLKQ